MKKFLYIALGMALSSLIILGTAYVGARPGPQPNPRPFEFFVRALRNSGLPPETYERLQFDGTIWDFGGRHAYACAYVEYIESGRVLFEVHFEILRDYLTDPNIPESIEVIQINDTDGSKEPVGSAQDPALEARCGDGRGPGPTLAYDGSPFNPSTVNLTAYRNGAEVAHLTLPGEVDDNEDTHWSPGAELGTAVMWYVEDGILFPIVQATIRPVADGITIVPPVGETTTTTVSSTTTTVSSTTTTVSSTTTTAAETTTTTADETTTTAGETTTTGTPGTEPEETTTTVVGECMWNTVYESSARGLRLQVWECA